MSLEIESIAEALFEKIRARFDKVSVGGEDTKSTTDPAKARFFNFNFTDKEGHSFGNVTISLIDEHSLKIYFGKNLSSDLNEEQKAEWYDFLRDMRMFAKRNLLSFDTRDISRSNLNLKDLKQIANTEAPATVNDVTMSESKLYGSTKTSYEKIAPGTRLIIRHSSPVDETIHGARSRKIQSVYIEDAEGQRFKSPFTHLGGARALGRHIAHGGQVGDDFGNHIVELVQEMGKIRKFIQGSRNKTFEDTEANDMVGVAKDRYRTVHQILGKLKNPRGYKFYKEGWKPSTTLQDDIDLEALRGKFVQKDFDNRLEDALPHVYAAYHAVKDTTPAVAPHIQEFQKDLDKIEEGTWELPDDDLKIKKLQELMSDVLPAGIDGTDATGMLYDIIGDDNLFDRIYDISQGSPETDVRPTIYDWLQTNMPDVFEKVRANMESGGVVDTPPQQEPTTESVVGEKEFVINFIVIDHAGDRPSPKERTIISAGDKEEAIRKFYDEIPNADIESIKERPVFESSYLLDIIKLAGLKR